MCRRGCNTRTATYTDDFVWEDIFHRSSEDDIVDLISRVKTQTKATRKRKRDAASQDNEVDVGTYVAMTITKLRLGKWKTTNDKVEAPTTPSKRRILYNAITPTSKSVTITPQKFTTPTTKR